MQPDAVRVHSRRFWCLAKEAACSDNCFYAAFEPRRGACSREACTTPTAHCSPQRKAVEWTNRMTRGQEEFSAAILFCRVITKGHWAPQQENAAAPPEGETIQRLQQALGTVLRGLQNEQAFGHCTETSGMRKSRLAAPASATRATLPWSVLSWIHVTKGPKFPYGMFEQIRVVGFAVAPCASRCSPYHSTV